MRRIAAAVAALAFATGGSAGAGTSGLVEAHMHIEGGGPDHPQVALTLDLCMGDIDMRVLSTLIDNAIPATLFVTRRWLVKNPEAIAAITAHPDLFEIENHGAEHVPAVLGSEAVYGITPAGSLEAVRAEIDGGTMAMATYARALPTWYRDATALYSPEAIAYIEQLGYHVAGFSLNGDFGASVSAEVAQKTIASAHDGDVIIAHLNQPKRPAGAGVAAGILALKALGFTFIRLNDAKVVAD